MRFSHFVRGGRGEREREKLWKGGREKRRRQMNISAITTTTFKNPVFFFLSLKKHSLLLTYARPYFLSLKPSSFSLSNCRSGRTNRCGCGFGWGSESLWLRLRLRPPSYASIPTAKSWSPKDLRKGGDSAAEN